MRLSTILMLIPVALIAVALGVANSEPVTFRFLPGDPALGVTMRLYLLVFLALFLGVLIGGAVVGFSRTLSRRKRESARHIGEALRQLDGNTKAADQSEA
jgi:uncharacterized membrane protein YciS (DUF1049 family)